MSRNPGICTASDRLCIENHELTASAFTVWYPTNQLPPTFVPAALTVSLVQGATTAIEPCTLNAPIVATWQFATPSFTGTDVSVAGLELEVGERRQAIERVMNATNRFYFLLNVPNRCLSGPYSRPGMSDHVSFTFPALPAIDNTTTSTAETIPLPTLSDPNSSSSADQQMPVGLVVGIVCSVLVVLLALVYAVLRSVRQSQKRSSSRHSQQSSTNLLKDDPVIVVDGASSRSGSIDTTRQASLDSRVSLDTARPASLNPSIPTLKRLQESSGCEMYNAPHPFLTSEVALTLAATFRNELLEPSEGWDISSLSSSND